MGYYIAARLVDAASTTIHYLCYWPLQYNTPDETHERYHIAIYCNTCCLLGIQLLHCENDWALVTCLASRYFTCFFLAFTIIDFYIPIQQFTPGNMALARIVTVVPYYWIMSIIKGSDTSKNRVQDFEIN